MFQAQWSRRTDSSQYDLLFCELIRFVIETTDGKDRQILLRRIYLESPMITEEAISLLKNLVMVSHLKRSSVALFFPIGSPSPSFMYEVIYVTANKSQSYDDNKMSFFKRCQGRRANLDIMVFVYFLSLKQRLRPLGYCAPLRSCYFVTKHKQ